ncbi:DeoR/GlpR family DNA-binding transcription regulator [Floccifex sp.]|uniref:DeoR/GlpR family DNA-binding transcription regulator n=1 Tax=Floccifex sp. TaxID=2815810 RepID=UPI003F012576
MQLMEERRKKIMEELKIHETVYVSELSKKYGVSYETIRKDLSYLENQGLLIKSHGGATIKQNAIEYAFNVREEENNLSKQAIAKKAMELIPDNCSIIIATGSTTLEIAKILALKSGYKIFTDSLPVANVLQNSDNQVFIFGGRIRSKSSSVFGGWTINAIEKIHVDIAFIGTDGFSNFDGPTTPSSSDAFIDQTIIKHAYKKYIVADYTKFSRNSLYKICDWQDITALITNAQADLEQVEEIRKHTNVILSE